MSLEGTFDPFAALGLERDATPAAIKARYYELARRYHPNRSQGSSESQALLSEYFFSIHQAWQLLCQPDSRRRCHEWLQLCELQEAVQASVADLLYDDEHREPHGEHKRPFEDGHVSSDADSDGDLPRIAGVKRRATFDRPPRRATAGASNRALEDIGEDSETSLNDGTHAEERRHRRHPRRKGTSSKNEERSSDNANTAAERRRRFDKLRRKELETFEHYRDAMLNKFEAEAAAQRAKEQFEQARWRREYYERAPKDSAQRVRLLKLFNTAAKALISQQPVRRRTSTRASNGFAPATPIDGSNFLGLPSRMKSVYRRGISSDVTGDQTSSDEGSSDRNKDVSPHRSPRAVSPRPGRPQHKRWESLPNVLTGHSKPLLLNGRHDPISPITGPGPQLFVRAPTNLSEMSAFNIHASDPESASASSRSNSPQPPIKKNDSGRFVILPAQTAAGIFEDAEDHRSRSPGPDRRSISTHGDHHLPVDMCHFHVKQIGQLHHRNIPLEHVHMLNYEEKKWMLGVEPDADMDPESLLIRLAKLDKGVAKCFMVKPDIKSVFNFRLIYNRREVVKDQHQTFIALSYRRKLHVDQEANHFTLPLAPEMFQAVWDERISDTEGLWVDQICIGDTEKERTISMSAMDMVYRSARLVVVALDDIEMEPHEAAILENHMAEFDRQHHVPANKRFRRRQTPYLESHDDLYSVIRKLLRSSWFQRAWCRHEMRLGRSHIFLVPCRTPGAWSGKSVLRFSGKCLTHLLGLATEVAFESNIETTKAALYAFFRDRSKLGALEHLRSHHGNFTTVVAEVFAMQAGGDPRIPEAQREADARKDKISIILNTMECGLALSPRMRDTNITLPEHECHYMLLLLALAARDPGALGTVGRPLREMPFNLSSTWLSEPTNVDAGLNNYRTLNRLPSSCRFSTGKSEGEHYIQLHLKVVNADNAVLPEHTAETMDLARRFLAVCDQRKLGRNRKRYLINDRSLNYIFGSMRDVYVETLVCVFECGPLWMSDVCVRYSVSRWKHDLQPAYELMTALKNTYGRWPESAWSNQAAGFIMDFVNFLIIRGMPHRQIVEPEVWRPVWVATHNGGRLVTFAPFDADIKVAVPVALFDSDYVKLARLWVLKQRGTNGNEWRLLGKSVVFNDDLSIEVLEGENGMIRRNQKVFGRAPQKKDASSTKLRLVV